MKELIERIEAKRKRAFLGGGIESIEGEHRKGKLTARERVLKLLDPSSFAELELLSTPIPGSLNPADTVMGDGVITGYGKIGGREVCIWAQDATVFGGRVGIVHAKKIASVIERAIEARIPCIGMYDSEGLNLQDFLSTPTDFSYQRIAYLQVQASGVIPQLSLVMGPCLGSAAISAQLSDFVFMLRNTSYLCVAPPKEMAEAKEVGDAWRHAKGSGCCDFLAENDEECIRYARELIGLLPSSNKERPPLVKGDDDPSRMVEELAELVPTDSMKPYSMYRLISLIVDNGYFLELKRYWANNLITGFARFDGNTVGIIANNPQNKGGCMSYEAADKMARFVQFCDAFNTPLLWLADTPAFLPAVDEEKGGIIRHGSKVVFWNSQISVPAITVYIRKNYGGGNLAMPGNNLGGDVGIAWPTAEIYLMWPEGAVAIIYRKQIEAAANPEEERQRRLKDFREATMGRPWQWITIQDYIHPRETRAKIIRFFQALRGKEVEMYGKKHNNIPL